MLERFQRAIQDHHEYARRWKMEKTGEVYGYFCCYVPEEIMYAANILPVRILGSHELQDLTEPHIYSSKWCPFCRDCLAQGLRGRYDYLDGIVYATACPQIGLAFYSWRQHIPVPYSYEMYVPHNLDSVAAKLCLQEKMEAFKLALERWLGATIPSAALKHSIETYNINRRLLTEIYNLRKTDNPPITGAETIQLILSSMLVDKGEHNRWLTELFNELPLRKQRNGPGFRLMWLGSENDDVAFMEMVESLGATVVVDDNCVGTRYFMAQASLSGDPLSSITSRYIEKPPCPIKDPLGAKRRLDHIRRMVKEFRVEGALIVTQKFCELHLWEVPLIQELFKDLHIPTLHLESDTVLPSGQFRTRIEAFLELVEANRA